MLDLLHQRRKLLAECDAESRQHGLPRVGRHRLIPTRPQVRSKECDWLPEVIGEPGLAQVRIP